MARFTIGSYADRAVYRPFYGRFFGALKAAETLRRAEYPEGRAYVYGGTSLVHWYQETPGGKWIKHVPGQKLPA